MNKSLIVQVTVNYKGMTSALTMGISDFKNPEQYLEKIKNHVEVAKKMIDKQTLQEVK